MQKSRCWRGLELDLLPLTGPALLLAACAAQPAPVPVSAPVTPQSSAGTSPAEPAASSVPAASSAIAATPPAPTSSDATSLGTAAASRPTGADGAALPPLPKGTLVLHIGDSFAAALGIDLGKRLKAAGLRSALEFKTASYIPNWSFSGDIPKFIGQYHPDLVLITLGANEIEIPTPEQRVGAIKHLVGELGGRPCVWIAPPLWKQDTGLLKVIQENIAPCRYLDSNALVHDLPRAKDKIHPSIEGREIWAGIVFEWLSKERVGSATQPWALRPDGAGGPAK